MSPPSANVYEMKSNTLRSITVSEISIEAITDATIDLLGNCTLRSTIGYNAMELINKHYNSFSAAESYQNAIIQIYDRANK